MKLKNLTNKFNSQINKMYRKTYNCVEFVLNFKSKHKNIKINKIKLALA